ncbi:MAG: hypothetical protein WKF57_13020 [Nakamurella sp.]
MTVDASIAVLLRADEQLAPDPDAMLRSIRQQVALRRRRRRSVAIGGAAFAAAAVVAVPSLVSHRALPPTDAVASQPAGPTITLVDAPAAPSWFALTLGTVPQGWKPYVGEVNKARTSLYAIDSLAVQDFRQTILVDLSIEKWAPGELTETIGGRSARVTAPDAEGGWSVVIDEGDGLRALIQLPTALDALTRDQVVTIAESLTVHDRTRLAVG